MKPIPVLGIPHYNRPDLTARCIASIDYPVEQLVIVDQGPVSLEISDEWDSLFENKNCPDISILRHPNAGVAGAWNEIIKLFAADWWLITNNDIAFAPGDLAKMAAAVEADKVSGLFYGNHGASWFGITKKCVHWVGLFDENFYPAYLEDCDYGYRCDLLRMARSNVPDVHALHGEAVDAADQSKGSCTIHSDPELSVKNGRTHGNNFNYYRAKWGGNNGEETFKHPFNSDRIPVWAWKFEPAMRANNQW